MNRTGQSILIFEPDPLLRRQFQLCLCHAGYRRIREAAAFEEARSRIRSECFSAIVCDGEHYIRDTLRLIDAESALAADGRAAAILCYYGSGDPDTPKRICRAAGLSRAVISFASADLCRKLEMALDLNSLQQRMDTDYRQLIASGDCKDEMPYLSGSTTLLREQIENVFCDLGLSPHLNGYHYLQTALLLLCQDPGRYRRITGELYPAVARVWQSTASRVERSIRTVIAEAWKHNRQESIERYFTPSERILREHPSNSRFLDAILRYLLRRPPEEL